MLKEIHYKISNKKYFGIGFKNDANGYEVRNKYSKICIGRKDITTIKNKSNNLRIFEGFIDYLSFKQMEKTLKKALSDYVILNSVTMIFKIEKIIDTKEKEIKNKVKNNDYLNQNMLENAYNIRLRLTKRGMMLANDVFVEFI